MRLVQQDIPFTPVLVAPVINQCLFLHIRYIVATVIIDRQGVPEPRLKRSPAFPQRHKVNVQSGLVEFLNGALNLSDEMIARSQNEEVTRRNLTPLLQAVQVFEQFDHHQRFCRSRSPSRSTSG